MPLDSVLFWINAFIPSSVCETVGGVFCLGIPQPGLDPQGNPGLVRLFAGDQREFSSDQAASARMHSDVTISGLSSDNPSFTDRHLCGESQELDSSGNIIARATASCDRMHFFNLRGSQTVDPNGGVIDNGIPGSVQIDVAGSAALPLLALAPDIDYSGTLIIDVAEGNVLFKGAVSGFPAFEMYFIAENGETTTLAQISPITPLELIGEENRPVDASTRIIL